MKQEPEQVNPASLVLTPQRAAGEPYTTSEIIAAGAGVQRRTVDHLLLAHKTDFEEFGILRFEIAKTGGRGRPEIIYHLNEQQATLLMTYLKNTEVVRAFKKELVRQFYAMRSLLLERASPVWQDVRSLGKEVRRQEADATVGIVERDRAQVVQLTALLLVEQTIAREITAGIEAGAPYWAIYRAIKNRLVAFPAVGVPAGKE